MNLRVDEPPRLVDHGRKCPDRPLLGGSGLADHEITPIESVDSVVTGGASDRDRRLDRGVRVVAEDHHIGQLEGVDCCHGRIEVERG